MLLLSGSVSRALGLYAFLRVFFLFSIFLPCMNAVMTMIDDDNDVIMMNKLMPITSQMGLVIMGGGEE